MTAIRGLALAALAWLSGPSAMAQAPAADPIGALLQPEPPILVDETGRNPDGPPSAEDEAYDGRIRSSAAAARAFQGPLDGSWSLSAGARELYILQLADKDGVLEGAWRDPRRPGALEGSGYLDVADRSDGSLVLSFTGAFAVLRLVDGRWTGTLSEGERTERVTLVRKVP
jgi:hypothetical protein